MRTTWYEVIKKCPKPYSLIRKNRFNPFDSVILTTLCFELLWHQKMMALQNFLQIIDHRVAYSARNYAIGNFLQNKQSNVLTNIVFIQNISKKFCIVTLLSYESSNHRVANSTESNEFKLFSRIKGMRSGTRLLLQSMPNIRLHLATLSVLR